MTPNIAASVRDRLLAQAKVGREEFERTLARFAAERWLYRLGMSGSRERCIVKGAALLTVWLPNPHRATRDIDLLAFGRADDAEIRELIAEVCAVACPEDGVTFDLSNLHAEPIRAEEEYAGVRALFWARLGSARIRMQVDFGVGDSLPSAPVEIEYPTMLAFLPSPRIRTYPREASVAEKFEAMVKLERRNSRMKDFHDLWELSSVFPFNGSALAAAIAGCFKRRGTPWTVERPVVLTSTFYQDEALRAAWTAYRRGGAILIPPPARFEEVGERMTDFLGPIRDSIVGATPFAATWVPGGPWA
jgi:predicted nucleotidyltransferase component of viral defense system